MLAPRNEPGKPMAEMNVIPLVDISLVLLIIFMVTSAFVKDSGLNLKLPSSAAKEVPAETPQDVTIAVLRSGEVYVDGARVGDDALLSVLADRARRTPQPRVILKGDEGTPYGRVVGVLDTAKESGFTRISLSTVPPPPKPH